MKEMYCKWYEKFLRDLFENEECPNVFDKGECDKCDCGEFRDRSDEDCEE